MATTSAPGSRKPAPRLKLVLGSLRVVDVLPVALFGLIVVVGTVALVVLFRSTSVQVTAGTSLIRYNREDQSRVYVQLQREALRFHSLMDKPADAYDADEVNLQYELLLSRVNHMRSSALDAIIPPDVFENFTQLDQNWETVDASLQAWMTAPDDAAIEAEALALLEEYERTANTAEINFNRARSRTLGDLAQSIQQLPVIFGVATVALIGLIVSTGFAFYRFLRQSQETAAIREANRVKDQFLAIMSHELRTPLNAIIGFLGIMKMGGKLAERELHMVDRSRANAERLLSLIDDILDISKIEAGRFDLHREVLDIRELNQRWKAQTEVLAMEKGLQFTATVRETVPDKVYTDPDALTKIVTNLLSNAIKFTKAGSIQLDIAAESAMLVVEVKDTGIGIPEDKQGIIFDSFRQVDSSTKRAFGGSGLGLFIVKQIATLLSGTVEVKSKPDVGSTFTVRIPLTAMPASVAATPAPSLPVLATSPRQTEGVRQ